MLASSLLIAKHGTTTYPSGAHGVLYQLEHCEALPTKSAPPAWSLASGKNLQWQVWEAGPMVTQVPPAVCVVRSALAWQTYSPSAGGCQPSPPLFEVWRGLWVLQSAQAGRCC
mmetsp:Transcript_103921/g.195640  ORF Transcript_103921/g.195640 Transcript_103921/m.195640 type:complete len:113 (+) Transcript_103921:66-404(+)